MLGCVTGVQRRDSSPKSVNGLRQGSVLDILRPQAEPVTVHSSAQDNGMLYYKLLSCANVS